MKISNYIKTSIPITQHLPILYSQLPTLNGIFQSKLQNFITLVRIST